MVGMKQHGAATLKNSPSTCHHYERGKIEVTTTSFWPCSCKWVVMKPECGRGALDCIPPIVKFLSDNRTQPYPDEFLNLVARRTLAFDPKERISAQAAWFTIEALLPSHH
ncbi:unnamed protein product [Heterosigma akashiwo]